LEEVTVASTRKNVYRAALRHSGVRWLMAGYVQSRIGDFMYSVTLVAVVFLRTGSPSWVAVTLVAIRVPQAILPPFAGLLVDRVERRRLMVLLNIGSLAVMAVMAVLVKATAPVALVVAGAVVVSVLSTAFNPAEVAFLAAIVPEDDLAASNAVVAAVESLSLLLGPALGALLLVVGSNFWAFAIDAATFGASALCLLRIDKGPQPTRADEGAGAGVTAGFRALSQDSGLVVMTAGLVAACFVVGSTTVLFLVVSVHRIGTGAHGYGYLLAAAGVGGLLATTVSERLSGSRRMAVVIAASLAVSAVGIAALAIVTDPVEAYAATVVWGAAYLLLEILMVTLLQRVVDTQLLGRATAAVDTLAFAAVLAGAAAAGPVAQHAGLTAAVLMVAAPSVLAALVIGVRSGTLDARADATAEQFQPRVAMLSTVGVLVGIGRPALEALASRLTEEQVASGSVVVRQGDQPDDFYVVVDGEFDVASSGGRAQRPVRVRTLGAGDVFGEIGLVERRPRTATVKATTDGTLYRIRGEDFLQLVAGESPAAGAVRELAAGRLRRTHFEMAAT
jgi:CRP-like cAMP-binding protein/predicted MFS family arabinose efflux permease